MMNMIPEPLRSRGEKFDDDHNTYLKYTSYGAKLAWGAFLLLAVAIMSNLLVDNDHRPIILISLIIVAAFLIFLTVVYVLKSKPFRKIGLDYVFLNAYRAYLSLESYEQQGKFEDKSSYLEEAKKEMNEIKWEIISGWKNFESFNQVIPKLDSQISLFILHIRKLSYALDSKSIKTSDIRLTLLKLMEYFSKDDYDINKINEDLAPYKEIVLPAKTPERIKDVFKKKKILTHIGLISLFMVIGIISAVIIWLLGGNRDSQLVIGGTFSSIPTGWYIINILKNRFEKQ